MRGISLLTAASLAAAGAAPSIRAGGRPPSATIIRPRSAAFAERLAAREVRRYVYVRTGRLLPMAPALPAQGDAIVVGRKDRPAAGGLGADLEPGQYRLRTVRRGGRTVLAIIGGDDVGTLHGAYRFAEHLGVRFFLHGDAIPDRRIPPTWPDLDETGRPLFALRGLNPWGSHPPGIDLWNADDYKAHIAQLAKMRMNFIGIHGYSEGHPYAEPTVWVGLEEDIGEAGRVKFAYPARYYNTLWRGPWGPMLPRKTSTYGFGGALLFERDDWGSDVMRDHAPSPTTREGCEGVFRRTGARLREAFGFARLLGVKTCVGTEAPLAIPRALRERLRSRGRDPDDPAAVREVYEGIFRRIMRTHPLDFYWIWTPESWTWKGNAPEELRAVVEDIRIALAARKGVGAPFRLATCGWVLGPKEDRAAFDRHLPEGIPVSAISRNLGHEPIDPAFARIAGRPKWAIPWMEDDTALASPQLWVGRTRKDAADALAHGCTGLMGLCWRTRIVGPNLSALARAAWDQAGWNPAPGEVPAPASPVRPEADPLPITPTTRGMPRVGLPIEDFFDDWARALFGPEAAPEIARIFRAIDGRLPRPASRGCPCGLAPDARPWRRVAPEYAFVDALERCRAKVEGAGQLARFDFWLDSFRHLRAQGRVACALGAFRRAMEEIEKEGDTRRRAALAAERAVPLYRDLLEQVGRACSYLLATVSTKGGLGTVVNWEHNAGLRRRAVEEPGRRLSRALGAPLPADLRPWRTYRGRPRLIVPTVRTLLIRGESLKLPIIVLDRRRPRRAAIHWRPMGEGAFRKTDLRHEARGVYTVTLPPAEDDLEYFIRARSAEGIELLWPATAPRLNQTVVVVPAP